MFDVLLTHDVLAVFFICSYPKALKKLKVSSEIRSTPFLYAVIPGLSYQLYPKEIIALS